MLIDLFQRENKMERNPVTPKQKQQKETRCYERLVFFIVSEL